MIRFSVKDTGIGISQADLGKLFKSFSQVNSLIIMSIYCFLFLVGLIVLLRTPAVAFVLVALRSGQLG
jgi:hypothetical protein